MKETKSPCTTTEHYNLHEENFQGEMKVISEMLLQLYMTLTFISHNSCPQETHPLRNWIKSSWTFLKSESLSTSQRSSHILTRSNVRTRHLGDEQRKSTLRELWILLFLSLNPKRGGCNEGEKNVSALWNKTPFWNLGWALESGSHPFTYLQAPVRVRRRPPACSFRSSGHTDPEQLRA